MSILKVLPSFSGFSPELRRRRCLCLRLSHLRQPPPVPEPRSLPRPPRPDGRCQSPLPQTPLQPPGTGSRARREGRRTGTRSFQRNSIVSVVAPRYGGPLLPRHPSRVVWLWWLHRRQRGEGENNDGDGNSNGEGGGELGRYSNLLAPTASSSIQPHGSHAEEKKRQRLGGDNAVRSKTIMSRRPAS
jgi:hypothetical protein